MLVWNHTFYKAAHTPSARGDGSCLLSYSQDKCEIHLSPPGLQGVSAVVGFGYVIDCFALKLLWPAQLNHSVWNTAHQHFLQIASRAAFLGTPPSESSSRSALKQQG